MVHTQKRSNANKYFPLYKLHLLEKYFYFKMYFSNSIFICKIEIIYSLKGTSRR